MTDTPPRGVSRRQARRAAFVLTYQLDVRAGSALDELAVRYRADTGMDVPAYTRLAVEGILLDQGRDRCGRGHRGGGLDVRPSRCSRARDPAARDLGAARPASCPRRS